MRKLNVNTSSIIIFPSKQLSNKRKSQNTRGTFRLTEFSTPDYHTLRVILGKKRRLNDYIEYYKVKYYKEPPLGCVSRSKVFGRKVRHSKHQHLVLRQFQFPTCVSPHSRALKCYCLYDRRKTHEITLCYILFSFWRQNSNRCNFV